MGTEPTDWTRKGYTLVNGVLERIDHGNTTHLGGRKAKARKTDFLNHSAGQASELERHTGDAALQPPFPKEAPVQRVLIVLTSHRRRLLDQDNLCSKYLVDLCRYAGIISSDAPGSAEIKIAQEKVGPKEPERVVIDIYAV